MRKEKENIMEEFKKKAAQMVKDKEE